MNWLQDSRTAYEDWLWKNSPELLALARNRLAVHN
jgi:hypothetical protein